MASYATDNLKMQQGMEVIAIAQRWMQEHHISGCDYTFNNWVQVVRDALLQVGIFKLQSGKGQG